jgi:hypothetical protein
MKTLLIDDMRDIKADVVARTFDEGIEALKNQGPFDLLYLDHDYGDPDPHKTGEGIMKFLEENSELLPVEIMIVSSNPVGRQRMQVIIDKLYGNH